jgi:hypothetical protein
MRLETRLGLNPDQDTSVNFLACLWHVGRLLQSEISAVRDLVLPLSIYLTSSDSCLRLLHRLSLTSILSSVFLSLTCFRRQFLRCMWPIQLAFLLFIVCRVFQPLTLVTLIHLSHGRSSQSPSFSLTTLQNYRFLPNPCPVTIYKSFSLHRYLVRDAGWVGKSTSDKWK